MNNGNSEKKGNKLNGKIATNLLNGIDNTIVYTNDTKGTNCFRKEHGSRLHIREHQIAQTQINR